MTLSNILTPSRLFFGTVFVACAVALGSALVGEYVYGLRPCVLCLYERIPYAVAGVVAFLMMLLPSSSGLRRLAVLLCLVAFAGNAVLGVYHVGVEQHWWASPACTGVAMDNVSVLDLQAALIRPAQPACDDIQWSLFGVTFAGFNLIYSVILAAFCAVALRNAGR